MAAYSNYALRVPSSLMEDLRLAAERDGVSMNGFIIQAVAEKIAALRARSMPFELSPEEQSAWLSARAARARPGQMAGILGRVGSAGSVRPGDEVPEGWLPASLTDPAGTPAAPAGQGRRSR